MIKTNNRPQFILFQPSNNDQILNNFWTQNSDQNVQPSLANLSSIIWPERLYLRFCKINSQINKHTLSYYWKKIVKQIQKSALHLKVKFFN